MHRVFDQKALSRTVLAEKGPILLRQTLINTEESYQTGFEGRVLFKKQLLLDALGSALWG